jgi:hypothetical protein
MTRAEKLIPLAHSTPSLLSSHICRISSFFFSEIMLCLRHPASHEGRFAIVTSVECGMRWVRRVAAWVDPRADEHPDAHGQAVWSWHPGADAKLATTFRGRRGQERRSPGRARSSRSNHRAGKAGLSGSYLWGLPPAFLLQAGHGCGLHPAFPAPSLSLKEGGSPAKLGRGTRREAVGLCPTWF